MNGRLTCLLLFLWAAGGLSLPAQPADLDALFEDAPTEVPSAAAAVAGDVEELEEPEQSRQEFPPTVGVPEGSLEDPEGSLVPEDSGIDEVQAALPYARSLAATPGYEAEAVKAYQMAAQTEAGPAFLREYAGVLIRARQYREAAAVFEQIGPGNLSRDESFTYALALRNAGRKGEADALTAKLVPASAAPTDPIWEMINQRRAAGQLKDALATVAEMSRRSPQDAKLCRITADLAFEAGDLQLAAEKVGQLVRLQPHDAELWKQQAGLCMARRDFRAALEAYQRALEIDPGDHASRRQVFRIHGILGEPDLADASLDAVFEPSADALLLARLEQSTAAKQSQPLQDWLAKHTRQRTPYGLTEALGQALRDGSLSSGISPESHAAVLLAWQNVQPLADLQAAAWMEKTAAAEARAGHNINASRLYRKLSTAEADNISALYGLAGALRGDGSVEEAIEVYETLVAINPEDPVASGALLEAVDLLRDSIEVAASFQNEDSPGRLANITRLQMAAIYTARFGDRWTLEAGPRVWLEAPKTGPSYWAEGFEVSALYRANSFASFDLSFGFKGYNSPDIPNTFTGAALVNLNLWDRAMVTLGYQRQDVITNQFNLQDGTQTDSLVAGFQFQPARNWDASLGGKLLFYNDNNTQFIGNARLAYAFVTKPGRLTGAIGLIGMQTQHESQENFIDGELASIRHPYWTPQGYLQGYASVGWEQNLAPASYAGQNELSYGLQFITSTDSTSNFLLGGEARIRWEIVRNLILQAAGSIQRSKEWNGASATISASYRF